MQRKYVLALCLILLWAGLAQTSLAASTITEMGRHPFWCPALVSEDNLREMVQAKSADIEKGFQLAGAQDIYPDFVAQFPQAQITEATIAPGTTLHWMFYRTLGKGPVKVAKDVTWAGKEPFEAFVFTVDSGGQTYEFVVPKACGNLGVLRVGPMAAAPAAAPVEPANQAPICQVSVTPPLADCGQEVTVDASGSSDPDGQVTSARFSLLDPQGKEIWSQTVSQAPFVAKFAAPCEFEKYTVRVVVTDDKGLASPAQACAAPLMVSKDMGGPVVDLGWSRLPDPSNFLVARVGWEYPLIDKLYLMGMIGGFFRVQGEGDNGVTAGVADVTLNYHWLGDWVETGVGMGLWASDHETVADVIANIGVKLYDDPDLMSVSLVAEVRSATHEFEELDREGRYGLGLRFRF